MDESDASRNRTRADFPAKVERSALAVAYSSWLPLNAERPLIGLPYRLEICALYPPTVMNGPMSDQVDPSSTEISTTPPS